MPYAKSLTKRLKAQRTPFVLERDYSQSLLHPSDPEYEEPVCCFCEQRFIEGHKLWHKTWEHLDNNDENQELWNLAWPHWHCNEKKKNDADLQIMAKAIIKKNQEWESNYDFELSRVRVGEKKTHTQTDIQIQTNTRNKPDDLTEAQMNLIVNKLAMLLLETELPIDSEQQIPFAEMLSDIHCLTIRETGGRGSEPAARRALDAMTKSKYANWEKKKLGKGNTIIQRRKQIQTIVLTELEKLDVSPELQ